MPSLIQRNRVFLLHFSFWCVYLSFFVYQITSFRRRETDLGQAFVQAGAQVSFNMLIAYLNYFFFLPRFLERQKAVRYLLEFSVPFIIVIILRINLLRYLIDGYTHKEDYFYSTLYTVQTVATTLFIVIFVGMLRFAKDWFEFEARKKEVENEKLTAELNFLKAQINPHFLFNTLNNLYYLAFTQSPNTTEVIAKLSQMMRYMIYDSNHSLVPLNKEIEYMQNYISLERLRLNSVIPIRFDVQGNPEEVRIAPLIFITFLENAFKHGVSNNKPDAWVNISVRLEGTECIYQVENSKISLTGEAKSGIGLQNVTRRLELTYPGKYQLTINDQPDRYAIQLNLTLS
jgi:two-component system sensor histidine kinase AlgZ